MWANNQTGRQAPALKWMSLMHGRTVSEVIESKRGYVQHPIDHWQRAAHAVVLAAPRAIGVQRYRGSQQQWRQHGTAAVHHEQPRRANLPEILRPTRPPIGDQPGCEKHQRHNGRAPWRQGHHLRFLVGRIYTAPFGEARSWPRRRPVAWISACFCISSLTAARFLSAPSTSNAGVKRAAERSKRRIGHGHATLASLIYLTQPIHLGISDLRDLLLGRLYGKANLVRRKFGS
jgi:hypothetical protein